MAWQYSHRPKPSWPSPEHSTYQHHRTESAPTAANAQVYPRPPYAGQARTYYASTSTVNVSAHPRPVAYHRSNATVSMAPVLPPRPRPMEHPLLSGPAPGSPPTWDSQVKPRSELAKWKSCSNLNQSVSNLMVQTSEKANATMADLEQLVRQSVSGGANVRDSTSRLLDQIITSIDLGSFCGKEKELLAACALPFRSDETQKDRRSRRTGKKKRSEPADYFSKVYLYSNSRLPPHLPLLNFYRPTYPLLRLAAQYSRRVYDKPSGHERHSYVDSDWRQGTKAMVIKSLPVDDLDTIVFAIRGTQSFLDWAVNVHAAPTSPIGFLDDASNCCHAGFLSVARKMVAPVAARLRTLLEEDPSRTSYSLMITGHSAGGAVATLIYLHLLSESPAVQSELTHLRGIFKHVHCVTFGAPPISFRPLQHSSASRQSKSMFFAFINEGDPVARADKGYLLSLLDLYASPAPGSLLAFRDRKSIPDPAHWRVPNSALAAAGRLVLLRGRGSLNGRPVIAPAANLDGSSVPLREEVEAYGTTDGELRGVVFGDPVMHLMDLYARRIDTLAQNALGSR